MSSTFLDSFHPYRSTSTLARDLIAPRPMPPVRLNPDPSWRSPGLSTYSFGTFGDHVRSIPLELAITAGLFTVASGNWLGWKKGDHAFFSANEGWFGKNTHNGGMDKLGHFHASYFITDILAQRIRANSDNPAGAEITAALVAMGVMTGVEIVDGFNSKYGFSREDLIADGLGAAFAVVRSLVPGMREKVDFRLMHTPASYERKGVSRTTKNLIIPAYRRQRYILAIKGSGFEALEKTPLRYAELHLGYDARGFHPSEKALGYPKERNFYIGVGLNLSEVLFSKGPVPNLHSFRDTELGWATRSMLDYVQIPYTSIYNNRR